MAEHGEIPTAWQGVIGAATFLGVAVAAFFGRKTPEPRGPENGNVMAQRLAELERRTTALDERIDDVFAVLGDIQRVLATCQADIREALVRLQERRK